MKDENKVSIVALKEISNKLSEYIKHMQISKTINMFILIFLIISITLSQVNHKEKLKANKDLQNTINKEIETYDKLYDKLKDLKLLVLEPERG